MVTIVWINASVIVRVLVATGRFFYAPQYPQFRLLPIGDETALYIDVWLRWLSIEVGREFNRRMKKRFDQLAIEMSSQSLTVYMGRNRKDRLPPDNSQNNQVGHKET